MLTQVETSPEDVRQAVSKLFRGGGLGQSYAERLPSTVEGLDEHYTKTYGTTRTDLDLDFLQDVPKDATICELGANAGVNLARLAGLGYTKLFGIDMCSKSMAQRTYDWHAAAADVACLPFPDNTFDLVFTSGCLLHVPPFARKDVCREVTRVTKRWIWGFESLGYSHDSHASEAGIAWPDFWPERFLYSCDNLRFIKGRVVENVKPSKIKIVMYMLQKEN
jgi:hypothetical protein